MEARVRKRRKLSRGKKIAFTLVTLFLVWILSDTLAYFVLSAVGKRASIFYGFKPAESDEQIARFYQGEFSFHPRWGWDIAEADRNELGGRSGRRREIKDRYKIKVFGDSFVYGAELDPAETFEAFVEEETGWDCLNYGVAGYGTDQALLKYLDTEVKTEYTILGIMDQNIERCVNTCRGLYYGNGAALKPKPRFALRADGSVALLPNPVADPSELGRLKDPEFLASLGEHDYWGTYCPSINAPFELNWPATRTVVSHFDYFLDTALRFAAHAASPSFESHMWRNRYYQLFEKDSEGIKVMRHIATEFAGTARARDEIPLVLVFPSYRSLSIFAEFEKKPYQSLLDLLDRAGLPWIDVCDLFAREDWPTLFLPDGHYNAAGNRLIGLELSRRIRSMEAARTQASN